MQKDIPATPVALTQDEIDALWHGHQDGWTGFARRVVAAHLAKAAALAPALTGTRYTPFTFPH
jgi:hypothetical protein